MVEPITAVGWGVSALGWVASPIISKLLTKGFDYLQYDTAKKLAQLEPKILVLERVMQVVETSPDRPRLEKLFKELKFAYYEAEEILDAVEYHCLKRQIQDGKLKSSMDKFRSSMANFFYLKNEESGMSKKKLIESLKKIEDNINEAHQILDKLNLSSISDGNRRHAVDANRATTAVSPHKVLGRDNDRDKIIEMLHEMEGSVQPSTSNSLCFSVIGIHGVGGSGKSTLAQLVYAHEEKDKKDKKEGHFDLVMWVHVSQSFRLLDIFKELYEAASEPKVPCPQFNNLNSLGKELERKLDGKRFLLVLDDVWCNKDVGDKNLPELLSPLKVGKRGSKILVTTRSKYVFPDLGPDVRYTAMPVPEFDETAFFELFMHYALEDGPHQSKFQSIGAEIAKKLMRSPLAARTVGGNLRRQPDVDHWRRVGDQDLFKVWGGPLWWSYYQLGEQARRCFAYCSIFPRRHHLYRDDLVRLWMAEGFTRSTDEGVDIEDVGQEIFNQLLSISFLQAGGQDWDYHNRCSKDYYLVHDLLHDLAEAVGGSDCFRIDNNTSQKGGGWRGDVPRNVRHLFVQNYDVPLITRKILKLRNLHTLIIYSVGGDTPVEEIVIKNILKSLPKLRVLAIASSLEKDEFIHKPYTFSVPESVGQLKHLRYLAFRTDGDCRVILPSSLNQLYQMQVLDFGACNDLVFSCGDLINLRHVCSGPGLQFSNISRLVSLQTIPEFKVSHEQGHEAKQLRYLNRLSGKLYISGLESVESREEALEVDLAAKKRLTNLTLQFSGGSKVAAEVLEGLCPPVGLETLEILGYEGCVYPNWMVGRQNGGPEKLQGRELKQLRHLNRLSGKLWIYDLQSVESREEALEVDLAAKKRLTDLTLEFSGGSKVAAEVLEALCPPVGLEKLSIMGYEGSVYPNWMVGRQNGGPEKLQKLDLFRWSQPGPAPQLEAFIHLGSLLLMNCNWNALPGNMEHLCSLEKLNINACLNVRSLPTLPVSLEEFVLVLCNDGFMKSCETDGHPNWQKIQHIPRRHIGALHRSLRRTWNRSESRVIAASLT